MIQEA